MSIEGTQSRTRYVEQKSFQPEEKSFEPLRPLNHREPRHALDQLAEQIAEQNKPSCLTIFWNRIKAFFRFLFCVFFCMSEDATAETISSKKHPPTQTQESVSLSISSSAPISPPSTQTAPNEKEMPGLIEVGTSSSTPPISPPIPQGFEALQQLEDEHILKQAFRFFEENPAQTGTSICLPIVFFAQDYSERIQNWILYALVTKKNPHPMSASGPDFIIKYLEPYNMTHSKLIQQFIRVSNPSIRALMHEFEVSDSSNTKTIEIQEEDLSKIEAILEQNLRTTLELEGLLQLNPSSNQIKELIDSFPAQLNMDPDNSEVLIYPYPNSEDFLDATEKAFKKYTPIEQVEFLYILMYYVWNEQNNVRFYLWRDTITYYLLHMKADQYISQNDISTLKQKYDEISGNEIAIFIQNLPTPTRLSDLGTLRQKMFPRVFYDALRDILKREFMKRA